MSRHQFNSSTLIKVMLFILWQPLSLYSEWTLSNMDSQFLYTCTKHECSISIVAKNSKHQTAANWLFARCKWHQINIHPISWIWVLFSFTIMKKTQLGCKIRLLTSLEVDNLYWLLRMFLDIEMAHKLYKLSENWQIWRKKELPHVEEDEK